MESEKYQALHARVFRNKDRQDDNWRRRCGCIRTSDKLKQILQAFPSPPPPSPAATPEPNNVVNNCISAYCNHSEQTSLTPDEAQYIKNIKNNALMDASMKQTINSRSWQVVAELVQLLQLSVTATALALYYLIYCYMQLVYYTLRSALYFHNADGPMKVTIGVVTVTSLIVGFNLILRLERLIGIF